MTSVHTFHTVSKNMSTPSTNLSVSLVRSCRDKGSALVTEPSPSAPTAAGRRPLRTATATLGGAERPGGRLELGPIASGPRTEQT